MKYIQSFKIFESMRIDMVIDQIKEILLPLEDEGLSINITTNKKNSRISKGLAKVILGVEIPEIVIQTSLGHITNRDSQSLSFYINSVQHLVSYMKGEGYKICDFTAYYLTQGNFKILEIVKNGKVKNRTAKQDPVLWLKDYFEEEEEGDKNVKEILISFKKI